MSDQPERERKIASDVGVGLAFGAALGVLVSVLASIDMAWALIIGAGGGLIAGAVLDQLRGRR